MSIDSKIIKRYANALLELAEERKLVDNILQDMEAILHVNKQNEDFLKLLKNLSLEDSKKIDILKKLFKNLQPISVNFLELLAKNKRLYLLSDMANAYISHYNQRKNIKPVLLTSAIILENKEIDLIINNAKNQLGYENEKLAIQTVVDPTILGGFILQIDGKEMDNSLKTRIKKMKNLLTLNNN